MIKHSLRESTGMPAKSLTAGVLLLAVSLSSLAADWPQWRGANRDGNVTDVSLPATWPKTLKEEWKVTVGIGHSSPVYANGRIYVFARQGEEEVLLCLDPANGKQIWRAAQPVPYKMHPAAAGHSKGPKSTPVVSNRNVYTFGISGVLSCYDAQTGRLKWKREFSKDYPNTSPLYGTAMSPLIEQGLLIAHIGGQDKGALIAFDAETGNVRWSNDADGPGYSSPIAVTLAGVRQIVTLAQRQFMGIDAATGKLLWKLPAKSEYDTNSVTIVSYKDMLILSREEQGLSAIKLAKQADGIVPQAVWTNSDSPLYLNTPVLQGSTLLALSVRNKGQFVAIDADTGKTLWQSPGRMGENAAILNLANKMTLMLTDEAKLLVIPANAKQFAPVAEYSVADSPTWAHPLVIGNHILIKDETTLRSLLI